MPDPLHILVIDHDDVDRMAVRRALESGEMTTVVNEAVNGTTAIELLKRTRFDCVLLDDHPPDRDGLDVLHEIRAAGFTTPVIMMIEQDNDALADEMIRAGVTDCLPRSRISRDYVLQAIRSAVRLRVVESQARQSEAFSRSLMESSADCLKLLTFDGRLERINGPGLCTLEIDDFADVSGRDWSSMWPPTSQPLVRGAVDAAAAGKQSRFQAFCPTLKGTGKWWDVQVSPIHGAEGEISGILSVSRDITSLKSAEKALHEGREQYRFLLESIPQMVWTALPSGALDYYNGRVTEYSGVSFERLVGAGWKLLLHPDDLDRTGRRWENSLKTGEPYEIEFRLRDVAGRFRWHLVRALPMRGADGTVIKWFGTCTDIDDQKRAEAELVESRDNAEAANKAKDQFLSVLSHELRTPLMPVLTTVQSLEMESGLSELVRSGLQIIRRNVEMEARLIDDLLDLTRVSKGTLLLNLETTDVYRALNTALDICRPDIETKRLSVATDFIDGICPVRADPARLQQLFWNLISNAVKFTPEEGTLTFRCRAVTGQDGTSRVRMEVSDTGLGIEPPALSRIFDAFDQGGQSVARIFGGLGLGLAVSKALITLHGGTISAHSAGKGRGATFTVELPVFREAELVKPERDPQSPGAPAGASGGMSTEPPRDIRILLVDDHEDTNRAMQRLLQRLGYEVQTAHSVQTALSAAAVDPPFDLLISDIGLPDGSGLQLMEQLLKRRPIKGIALSGFGMEEDVRKSKQAGFYEHLTKPINFKRLETAIRQLTTGEVSG